MSPALATVQNHKSDGGRLVSTDGRTLPLKGAELRALEGKGPAVGGNQAATIAFVVLDSCEGGRHADSPFGIASPVQRIRLRACDSQKFAWSGVVTLAGGWNSWSAEITGVQEFAQMPEPRRNTVSDAEVPGGDHLWGFSAGFGTGCFLRNLLFGIESLRPEGVVYHSAPTAHPHQATGSLRAPSRGRIILPAERLMTGRALTSPALGAHAQPAGAARAGVRSGGSHATIPAFHFGDRGARPSGVRRTRGRSGPG